MGVSPWRFESSSEHKIRESSFFVQKETELLQFREGEKARTMSEFPDKIGKAKTVRWGREKFSLENLFVTESSSEHNKKHQIWCFFVVLFIMISRVLYLQKAGMIISLDLLLLTSSNELPFRTPT